MSKDSKALMGRKAILEYLGIGKKFFYTLMEQGLPVRRVGGRLIAHRDELDEWCRANPDVSAEPE